MKASGERTYLEQEVESTAMATVHVGTGVSCLTSVEKKGADGVPATDLPSFPFGFVMQVLLCFLRRLCLSDTGAGRGISNLRQKPTRTRTTPTHSSHSDGAVESTIGHLTGQVRNLRVQVEMMHGSILHPNMCIWPWLTRHSSWLMNRFSVRVIGRTAHEEAFDSEWKGDLCVMAGTILFREAEMCTGALVIGRRRRKADVVWHRGSWLGRAEQANEHIVRTEIGVFLTRNVRR